MSASGFVHLEDCEIVRESESGAAFLIRFGDEQHWLPKSQIADADDLEVGMKGFTLSITEWIAKKKGIDFDD